MYCWSKLLLDRYAQPSDFDDPLLTDVDGPGLLITPPGKTPEDVVTDFLTQLYQHVMERLASKINESILSITPIEFWFTIPALWSIRAENSTRDAAVKAGFGSRPKDNIHLIREPEAAVICCLNEMTKDGGNELVKVHTVASFYSERITGATNDHSTGWRRSYCMRLWRWHCGKSALDSNKGT